MSWGTRLLGAVRVEALTGRTGRPQHLAESLRHQCCSWRHRDHPCSNVTESVDNPWRDSLGSEASAEIILTPLSRRPCFTLWWLGLSRASIQGMRTGSISGMLSLWGREWIATTEKNQFPNLLFIFTRMVSCERALGVTCCSTSPCGFPCVCPLPQHISEPGDKGERVPSPTATLHFNRH